MMFRDKFVGLYLLVFTLGCAILCAGSTLSSINLGPINPPPTWGATCLYNVYVSQNGKPVKNVKVECWFSGQHGLKSTRWSGRTKSDGRFSFIRAIPKDWQRKTRFVDLNAACTDVGVSNNWRIK